MQSGTLMYKAKLRSYLNFLFPVQRSEQRSFWPMFLMIFFIAFTYNLLKIIKDTIVVSAAGAEAIPFIKLWVMFPMAVVMTAFFTAVSQVYSQRKVFFIIMSIFLVSIGLFLTVLFPLREAFFLHSVADGLSEVLPSGLNGLIDVIRYWPLAVFYTMAELWGSMVMFVLFWGFANRVVPIEQAKRFYPLFGIAANSSGFFASNVFMLTKDNINMFTSLSFIGNSWEKALFVLGSIVLVAGLASSFIFWWLEHAVFKEDTRGPSLTDAKGKKTKMGLFESIQYLWKNQYIRNIAIIVIVYNISSNLTEVIWKGEVHKLYPDPEAFGTYMSQVMIWISLFAIFSDLCISSSLIRRFGWTTGALVTPVILLLTSVLFFSFLIFDLPYESSIAGIFGVSLLSMSTFFGSIQNVAVRASKYSLFDITKEIAFIPLDNDSKMRGKAAIDGVGSRLGKSGGSVILQSLFLFVGNLSASFIYVAVILSSLLAFWFAAVLRLGRQFTELTADTGEGNANEPTDPTDDDSPKGTVQLAERRTGTNPEGSLVKKNAAPKQAINAL